MSRHDERPRGTGPAPTDGGDAVFEAERRRLRAVGYRMLGTLTDADDVVQDTWLRWNRLSADERAAVERPGAWLTTTATRLALDRLKSAQRQREEYVGPWLPEPIITDADPAVSAEFAESLTLGFLTVLERLGPVERAVFLLAEVFDEPYSVIAPIVGRSEDACRQIASRARRRVREERPVRQQLPPLDRRDADELVRAFVTACVDGRLDEFRKVLADDVVLVSDGGANAHAARRPVRGVYRVGRLLANLTTRIPDGTSLEAHEVNGEPGFVVSRDGRPWYVIALEVRDGLVVAVRLVINPDKLRHVGSTGAL